jgi:hypothetical protein
MTRSICRLIVTISPLMLGCSASDDGVGNVAVRISGQEFVKTGWPAMDGDERVAFYDAWKVQFEHVVVNVRDFRLAQGSEAVTSDDPHDVLVDVRTGDLDLWRMEGVKAQRWNDVGFTFAPASKDSEVIGEVPDDLVETMRDEKLSLWIEGTGEKDGRTVRFQFGIPGEVVSSRCLNGRDETDGMIVGEGRTAEVEVTLHMDHLFWDDHDAEEPHLLFGPLAYAAGDDDLVTLDELADLRLTDLRNEHGEPLQDQDGELIVYVPRVELSDNNLRDFIVDTALTLGHFNGEGHCKYELDL